MSMYASDPGCIGICLTASDVGLNKYGNAIAYPHPDCPAHGSPTENDEVHP